MGEVVNAAISPPSSFDTGQDRAKRRQLQEPSSELDWATMVANSDTSEDENNDTHPTEKARNHKSRCDDFAFNPYFNIKLLQTSHTEDEMNLCQTDPLDSLPCSIGSPMIQISVALGRMYTTWNACIDTGSERTCCTRHYALQLVGDRLDALLQQPANMPKLRSATGHQLKVLGALNTTITIGGFSIKHPVIVYAGNHKEALLGNDIIRGNLTINVHPYGEPEECTNLIHDREERKALIEDTKGVLPEPTGINVTNPVEPGKDHWWQNLDLKHLSPRRAAKPLKLIRQYLDAFSKSDPAEAK
jgi:hypothetical protein